MTPFEAVIVEFVPTCCRRDKDDKIVAIYKRCLVTSDDGVMLKVYPITTSQQKALCSVENFCSSSRFLNVITQRRLFMVDLSDPDSIETLMAVFAACKMKKNTTKRMTNVDIVLRLLKS